MTWQEYERKLDSPLFSAQDKTFLEGVFEFAKKCHEGDQRLSGEEYFTHPVAVSLKLAELKLDVTSVAAGLLHDSAEKDPALLREIQKQFGEEVAFLVDGVTKVDKVKAQGTERALESVRKMFLAVAKDIRVVMIKLMDREHNMETLGFCPPEKRERISRETLALYAPLAERLGMWNVKARLEDLAMRSLWPKEYELLQEEIKRRMPEREELLKKIVLQLESELPKERIPVIQISSREKHLYSAWQKLERHGGDWFYLSDLAAVRIIVPDVKACYGALGVIHALWKPVPARFKDYIALPKPNGYQSLHTTVFIGERVLAEFQTRTPEMHEEAENGIAAHWAFSEAGKPREGFKALGKKFKWIRQLHAWQKEFEKSHSTCEELLEALKIDFFKDRIFVLTPKGDVIDLPKGATPLDFAYHIHSEIGNHAAGAKVNGALVPFSRELKSGEVLEILTQRNKKPTREWLNLVKTSLAKSAISKALVDSGQKTFLAIAENPLEIQIYGKNRVGFIKDITSVFAKRGVSIQTLNAERFGGEHVPIRLTFVPRNKAEAGRIAERLKGIPGVEKVNVKIKS